MPRIARGHSDGLIYHVINRGNGRQDVFHKDGDFKAFLELMAKAQEAYGVGILAYCLMNNHFHLLLQPSRAEDLSKGMQWLMTSHVRRYHRHYGTSGHVWQGRYKSFIVQDDDHLLTVVRYIEGNPVRAEMTASAKDWPWSSHPERVGRTEQRILAALPIPTPANWTEFVDIAMTSSEIERLRRSVNRQAPFGCDLWVNKTMAEGSKEKAMPEYLYRFRRTNYLLELNELENQEIYFAAPEQLNDPMEGVKDIFWKGDKVVWENLLKHYLLCLEHCCLLNLIGGDEHAVTSQDIPLFKSRKNFPTPKVESVFEEICTDVFSQFGVDQLAEKLSKRKKPIRRNELIFHLKLLHPIAINSIFKAYESHGFVPPRVDGDLLPKLPHNCHMVDLIHQVEDEYPNIDDIAEKIYSTFYHTNSQIELIAQYSHIIKGERLERLFLHYEFPEAYVKKLDSLIFAEWYVACFMEECTNSSAWGNYGDNHKGVCLIFNTSTENEHRYLDLEGINGSGDGELVRHQFFPVTYQNVAPTIDFFGSFGRLNGYQRREWFTDDNGKESDSGKIDPGSVEEWRRRYWDGFYSGNTWKSKDWKYEKEHRLILDGFFNDYSKEQDRKLKYKFQDLHGIIFGVNTSMRDKLEISKIIEAKCKREKRINFKFYQAYYSPDNGSIAYGELGLLKFEV